MMRRLTAVLALATFVAALLLPSVTVTHAWNDADLSGGEGVRLAGHTDASLDSARPGRGAEHCALCHWLRSLGSSAPAGAVLVVKPAGVSPCADAAPRSLVAVFGDACPARAPPVRPAA